AFFPLLYLLDAGRGLDEKRDDRTLELARERFGKDGWTEVPEMDVALHQHPRGDGTTRHGDTVSFGDAREIGAAAGLDDGARPRGHGFQLPEEEKRREPP